MEDICIQVFITVEACPVLRQIEGSGHDEGTDARYGIKYAVEFDTEYSTAYSALIDAGDIESLPIEYYAIKWTAFSRDAVTSRNIPLKPELIDSSLTRYQNGSDVFISHIVRGALGDEDKVAISLLHYFQRDIHVWRELDGSLCAIHGGESSEEVRGNRY